MKSAYCPYCQNHTLIADEDWGFLVECEGPGCGRFFPAGSPSPSWPLSPRRPAPAPKGPPQWTPPVVAPVLTPTPEPAVQAPPIHLTAPHFCHTCGEEISTPFGRRRHTILHKCAGRPEAVQTGVYAAIYYCPHCHNPPTLLESPSHQWGQETACPVCAGRFLAPRDDVLHRRPGDVDPGGSFSFACPSCEERLECNALFKGQSVAGLSVVCPHCHHLLEIPSGGWR